MNLKKGLEKITTLGAGFTSTVSEKIAETTKTLEERGKEYMTTKGDAQLQSLKDEMKKVSDKIKDEYKKAEKEVKKVIKEVAANVADSKSDDPEENTKRVIKSDILDTFVKEKNGSWNNDDWNTLIADIEAKFGIVNRDKIGLTLEKLKNIL